MSTSIITTILFAIPFICAALFATVTLSVLPIAAVVFLLVSLWAYNKAFYSSPKRSRDPENLPDTEQFNAVAPMMHSLINELMAIPCEKISIQSPDGRFARLIFLAESTKGFPVRKFGKKAFFNKLIGNADAAYALANYAYFLVGEDDVYIVNDLVSKALAGAIALFKDIFQLNFFAKIFGDACSVIGEDFNDALTNNAAAQNSNFIHVSYSFLSRQATQGA